MKIFSWPRVTVTCTPWGEAYTVSSGGAVYESSCDGTLWNRKDGPSVSFNRSEFCRFIVRWARRLNKIERVDDDKWDRLLAEMSPDFRANIMIGGQEGRANARQSGLLP